MELKKAIRIILTFILMLSLTLSVSAEGTEVVSLSRISVMMPEITVEINGSGYHKDEISATLDSEKLTVLDATDYTAAHTNCVYVLVDLSTSMQGSFALVKNNIVSFIESMDEGDKIILITFGEKEVNTLLTGNESREDAVAAVKKLQCNENGTLFYEALNRAYQLSASSDSNFDREYVLAFSDGVDVQKGSSTFDEVIKLYDSHALPLYAACSAGAAKSGADRFGELARASGGRFETIDSQEVFGKFLGKINNVSLVKLQASTNFADGKEKQLSLKVGSSQLEYNVPITRSISDDAAPTVEQLSYDIDKDAFVISFSEKVLGADSNNAYKITDAKGRGLEVSEVFYAEADDAYEIKTRDPIYRGTYTFEFSGIKDESKEANALSGKQTLSVEKAAHRAGLPLWAILLIVFFVLLLLAGGAVVLILLLKKKDSPAPVNVGGTPAPAVQNVEYEHAPEDMVRHHIKTNSAVRIRLRIVTGKTSEQNIETGVVSSLIIGRSNTCDVYIDDTKLSRQHFVLENDNGTFYVMDLQSRNGTMLNGIRINSRQKIRSGDKILAGLSDITITILGR